MESTTIQISGGLRDALQVRKLSDKESYENIIWDLLEDSFELSEETKQDLKEARIQIKKGEFKTLSEIKKEFDLNV